MANTREKKLVPSEQNNELKNLFSILDAIHNKAIQLKRDAKRKGPGSIDFSKSNLMQPFDTSCQEALQSFNANVPDEPLKKMQAIFNFNLKIAHALKNMLIPSDTDEKLKEQVFKTNSKILCQPRNMNRYIANTLITFGFLTGSFVICTTGTLSFLEAVATVFGADLISNGVRKYTGLYDLTPDTPKIIYNLSVENKRLYVKYLNEIQKLDKNWKPPKDSVLEFTIQYQKK